MVAYSFIAFITCNLDILITCYAALYATYFNKFRSVLQMVGKQLDGKSDINTGSIYHSKVKRSFTWRKV